MIEKAILDEVVSEMIQQNDWHLYFHSGNGSCSIDNKGFLFNEKAFSITGCLAIMDFRKDK